MYNSSDSPASGSTTGEVLADLKAPGQISYVYLGAGKRYSELDDAAFVLAYHPNNDCCNVLYADGRVGWSQGAEAKWVIAELKAGRNPPRPFGATSQPSG